MTAAFYYHAPTLLLATLDYVEPGVKMVLEVIYVVRHGFRSNWVVNPDTGAYTANVPSPTGIPSDPALASYGEEQARQLSEKIVTLDPPVDVIYSSPFYRCLQTLEPTVEKLFAEGKAGGKVRVENGLGEFYGQARFDHPSPATLDVLHTHFPELHQTYKPLLIPSTNGESITVLHERIAYTLHRIIADLDANPTSPKALLICTHAASIIAIGRVLTGYMPADVSVEDFKCYTCGLSKFIRRKKLSVHDVNSIDTENSETPEEIEVWDPSRPEIIPRTDWQGGRGIQGGWDCVLNSDCSFLRGGEERGWRFSGDEAFLQDPNAFNDASHIDTADMRGTGMHGRAIERVEKL